MDSIAKLDWCQRNQRSVMLDRYGSGAKIWQKTYGVSSPQPNFLAVQISLRASKVENAARGPTAVIAYRALRPLTARLAHSRTSQWEAAN